MKSKNKNLKSIPTLLILASLILFTGCVAAAPIAAAAGGSTVALGAGAVIFLALLSSGLLIYAVSGLAVLAGGWALFNWQIGLGALAAYTVFYFYRKR